MTLSLAVAFAVSTTKASAEVTVTFAVAAGFAMSTAKTSAKVTVAVAVVTIFATVASFTAIVPAPLVHLAPTRAL